MTIPRGRVFQHEGSPANSTGRFLIIFFGFTVLFGSSSCSFEGRIRAEENTIFIIYSHQITGKENGFQQSVDVSLFKPITPESCSTNSDTYCLKWGTIGMFNITKKDDSCEYFQFTTTLSQSLTVTFDISNLHLYGGQQQYLQPWPVETIEYEENSYIVKEEGGQALLEPYWLASNGMYVYVDEDTPLFITQSSRSKILQLIAKNSDPYNKHTRSTNLKYTVCKKPCMKSAHLHAVEHQLGKPKGIPDERMVRYPIWSTWAKYKKQINEKTVLEFASKIVENKLPNSQLEIDDMWQTCYGSLTVNTAKFPNMTALVEKLKAMGFRVTIWTHPFVNIDCYATLNEGIRNSYFVKSTKNGLYGKWWNGQAASIDFTNPKAVEWHTSRLRKILEITGIDSFKFDAGESSYNPQTPIYNQMQSDHPDTYLKAYMKTAASFGNMIEVRAGRHSQEYPMFTRMINRNTIWDGKLGFQTIIPCLLQMNIIGYPFVLPGMIAGNGYGETEIVTDEMFMRWIEINAFMPSLQFSYPPWERSQQVKVQYVAKKYIDLHAQYANKIIAAMKQAVEKGTPVNPPIWWIDPHDPVTYDIDDEYLLGEDLLVAPVVKKGSLSRHIYLPKGIWKEEMHQGKPLIQGPIWLYNYQVPLDELAYFTKVEDDYHHHDDDEHHHEDKNGAQIIIPDLATFGLTLVTLCKLVFFFV